jgi:hypothetical protein
MKLVKTNPAPGKILAGHEILDALVEMHRTGAMALLSPPVLLDRWGCEQ